MNDAPHHTIRLPRAVGEGDLILIAGMPVPFWWRVGSRVPLLGRWVRRRWDSRWTAIVTGYDPETGVATVRRPGKASGPA